MSKGIKIWMIVGASLILLGALIFVGVMSVMGWDFKKLSTEKYETNTYSIDSEYKNITLITDTANVTVLPSQDGKTVIECYEKEKEKHAVSVEGDGTLTVKVVDERSWYDHISIGFNSPKITLYIPEGEYGSLYIKGTTGDVKIAKDFSFSDITAEGTTGDVECYASSAEKTSIRISTGDVLVENITCGSLDLKTTTGSIIARRINCSGAVNSEVRIGKCEMDTLSCRRFNVKAGTGDITLKGVIAYETMRVDGTTGDVELYRCDASELDLTTTTGDIEGTLLTDKVFTYKTNTGDVDLPESISGGICRVKTVTGDIEIDIVK